MMITDHRSTPRSGHLTVWGIAVLVALGAPTSVRADSPVFYRFIEVAPSSSNIKGTRPALNDDGLVAFYIERSNGTARIRSGRGGRRRTIADSADGFFTALGRTPSINGDGHVAFSSREQGVFRFADGTTTPMAEPGFLTPFPASGPLVAFAEEVSISGDGTVFFRSRSADGLSKCVCWSTADQTGPVKIKNGSNSNFSGLTGNNDRVTAFYDTIPSPGADALLDRLLLVSTFPPHVNETIASEEEAGEFEELDRFAPPSVNDSNTVAFRGILDNGVRGVFTGSGGDINTIANDRGPFSDFRSVAINSRATVAFAASLDGAGGSGIFVGPDPVLDRVVGSGDRILHKTVDSVSIGPEGLNDREQIAFHVLFTNGRTAIVRADPLGTSLPADPVHAMQMSTGFGTSASAGQTVPVPLGIVDLIVDLRFLAPTGELVFRILDHEVGRVAAPSYPDEAFATSTFAVDLRNLPSGEAVPDRLPLTIELSGPPGSTVQVESIAFPGLGNGDFERGHLDGWEVYARDGGAVTAVLALPVAY